MATNWPNSVQTFSTVSAGDSLNSPSHSGLHNDVSDTVEALQNYAGLVLVKTQTVGSGVSSVTVSDAFSSAFSAYKIILSDVENSTNGGDYLFQFNSSHANNYYGVGRVYAYNGGISTRIANNGASVTVGRTYTNAAATVIEMTVRGAYDSSVKPAIVGHAVGNLDYVNFGYIYNVTTSFSQFVLSTSSGTMTGGTISVYGFNNG